MAKFGAAVHDLKKQGCDMAVLGCTELSLVKRDEHLGKFFIDSTEVLCRHALEACGVKPIGRAIFPQMVVKARLRAAHVRPLRMRLVKGKVPGKARNCGEQAEPFRPSLRSATSPERGGLRGVGDAAPYKARHKRKKHTTPVCLYKERNHR